MRAAVSAMRQVCERILREGTIAGIENEVATLDDVFDLLNYRELAEAETRYLPSVAVAAE